MKNYYFIIITLAFFSDAAAQSLSTQSARDLDRSGYSSIILYGYNILWVFNDVGNVNSNRNGNGTNTISESESSLVETSLYPVPANDHLNFTFSTDINSGMIIICDAAGKIILTQKISGKEEKISSSNFIPGIYYYQVLSGNKSVSSGKFVRN